MRHLDFEELTPLLLARGDLLMGGTNDREIAAAVRSGVLRRVRRGRFVVRAEWTELWEESRHLLHVQAVALDARMNSPVFSHVSAAVLWGLPLYRTAPSRVHVFGGRQDHASVSDVMRHDEPVHEDDIVMRHGLRCTSLERTTFDVIRTMSPEAAVSCADAAARLVAADDHAYDDERHAAWLDDVTARIGRAPGARGIRQARWVAPFADGRAHLPLESVSRLQLVRLGFARPRLQVPVPAPHGGNYWVDIGLDEVNAFGECDGRGKYTDPRMLGGKSPQEVVLAEKRREDWIRGVTQRRFARWEDEHAVTPAALGARLASFGIRPPG